jgi:hypothetical protein
MKMTNEMICPACGAEMNVHTDKIDYSNGVHEEAANNSGEMTERTYSCSQCVEAVSLKSVETNDGRPKMIRRSSFAYPGIL